MHGIFCFDFFNPCLYNHMRGIASIVKTFPKRMICRTTLIRLLPLLTHGTQCFLHFAPTQCLTFGTFEQTFGFDEQLFTYLVSSPTLPPL